MQPDILIVMTDQQRANLTAAGGYPVDTMPFSDGIAATGTTFGTAYTAAPACVPARTSLLTGRFPSVHGVRQNSTPDAARYATDLLDVLGAAGYTRLFAGKPHMYRGRDDFDGYAGPYMHTGGPETDAEETAFDAWLHTLDHGVSDAPTPFPLRCQLPFRIARDAIALSEAADPDRPALLWVSFPEPHNPYQVPAPYFDLVDPADVPERVAGPEAAEAKGGTYAWLRALQEEKRPGYDDAWRRYAANYLGMLRLLDDQIARVHAGFAARGRPMIVIMLADHGDYVGEYGLQRKGAGVPELLMRIPLAMAGPGVAVQHRTEPVSIVDVLPTVCEAVGQPIPAGVQGRSLLPLLRGEDAPGAEFGSMIAEQGFGGLARSDRPTLHFSYEGSTFDELNAVTQAGAARMLRCGEWKLVVHADLPGELYRLSDDPLELTNLFDDPDHLTTRAELLHLMARWQARLTDELPLGAYPLNTTPHNWRWAAGATEENRP